jgi:hypothetical protein
LFVGIAVLLTGLGTGLAPILQTRRVDLTQDLKAGVREGGVQRSRLRAGLLVFKGALSVVLLIGAGLFVRSLQHVRQVRLGYDPDSVLIVDLNMRGVRLDSAHAVALRRQLLAAAQGIPGVAHVSRRVTMPFWSTWNEDPMWRASIRSTGSANSISIRSQPTISRRWGHDCCAAAGSRTRMSAAHRGSWS